MFIKQYHEFCEAINNFSHELIGKRHRASFKVETVVQWLLGLGARLVLPLLRFTSELH